MLSGLNNSKEVIKTRMLKHALNYWDIKSSDDLDPAVKLILEALSTELYNLGNEIKDTQVRILEKLANLMAPDFLTCPTPAHAIMHAMPVEPVDTLNTSTVFLTQKKISSKQDEVLDKSLDVSFTPVNAVQVFDAQVTHIATAESLYAYNATFSKQLVAQSRSKFGDRSTLWIGLKINPKIEAINGLYFYFDWKNVEPRLSSRTYQLLPITKWYINDSLIEIEPGLKYGESKKNIDAYENIFLEYDILSLLEKDVKHYYDQRFITITGQINIAEIKSAYPPSFKNNFSDNDLQKLTDKLLWVKLVFPSVIQPEIFDEIQVYANAFPVINRKVNDLKFRLKGGSNIVPLKTDTLDQFLSVKSLTDDTHNYKPIPYRKADEQEYGTYTLRNGGVERFDARNARELIRYLLELLRSESAAFASYGYDFMATTLKEMHQKIALMEQKTKGYTGDGSEVSNYIIVKPFEGFDMMYVKYWTTLADTANQLRLGTRLQPGKSLKVKPDSLILLTTTTGGKTRLRAEDRLQAFRYGIMTRDRIITKEDIRNFCFFEMGDKISSVEVEKGMELSLHPRQAFVKTIDVILFPLEYESLPKSSWDVVCEQLKSKLQLRSGIDNNYRVMIKQSA